MALFDTIVQKKDNFKGYEGNPPVDEADYNSRKDEMFEGTIPTWSEIQTEMDNYVSPQDSGNQKLLDLGLTQAEATALTGYTPPVEE